MNELLDEYIRVRVTKDEAAALKRICADDGTTVSAVLRQGVRSLIEINTAPFAS